MTVLEVLPSDTLGALQQLVERQLGILAEQQRLLVIGVPSALDAAAPIVCPNVQQRAHGLRKISDCSCGLQSSQPLALSPSSPTQCCYTQSRAPSLL